MFHPQPTPYSSFASYGVGTTIPDISFQSTGGGGGGGLVVDSGGPTVFRDPIFSPVANSILPPFNHNHNHHNPIPFKMTLHNSTNDLEAQEALARDFQPALEVCVSLAHSLFSFGLR